MEELLTVSQVSNKFNVSTRMLRYYEKLGLISSTKKSDYAYRMFDNDNLIRLNQILILRKLQISLKEIKLILDDKTAVNAISIFEKNLSSLNAEAKSIDTVRTIIMKLLYNLKNQMGLPVKNVLLNDNEIIQLANSLSVSSTEIQKERKISMQELENAEKNINKMTDVRIVHLPSATVAAAHFVGDNPEDKVGLMISDFARENKLWEKYPGLRLYGFNHPNPVDESGYHGYEMWITIPDDMEVKPPLVKKQFKGGTYAAHMIQMGNFHEWAWLDQWVRESTMNGEYAYCGSGVPENMFGSLEEHLNYHDHIIETKKGEPETTQLDLLIPVVKKK